MRYKSNLEAPDLSAHFKLLDPPKQIMGHDAPSDPDFEPGCTFWTHDEAAILDNIALEVGGEWVDIGSRLGWTAKHINFATNRHVMCVDPEYDNSNFLKRFRENMPSWPLSWIRRSTSGKFFETFPKINPGYLYRGLLIDGNHDSPEPLNDAKGALSIAANGSVIMLHDFWGKPIRDAVNYLLDQGWNCRVYWTPNGVACCWRGLPDFVPPYHVRDPQLEAAWENIRRQCAVDFDFGRCK